MQTQSHMERVVDEYVSTAILHGQSTLSANPDEANSAYNRIIASLRQLHDADPQLTNLEPLLNHADDSVKVFSAAALLFTRKKDEAERVLEKLSHAKGLIAFNAEVTLSEFRAGRLIPLHKL